MQARAVAVPRVCSECWDFAGALRVAGTILGLVLAFVCCRDATAAVSRFAAKGGVLARLDWPASSRPQPKPVLPWPAPVSFALVLPITALARP